MFCLFECLGHIRIALQRRVLARRRVTVLRGVLLVGHNDHIAFVYGNLLGQWRLVATSRPHAASNG